MRRNVCLVDFGVTACHVSSYELAGVIAIIELFEIECKVDTGYPLEMEAVLFQELCYEFDGRIEVTCTIVETDVGRHVV